jgi:hypothetical protein
LARHELPQDARPAPGSTLKVGQNAATASQETPQQSELSVKRNVRKNRHIV